MLYQLSYQDSLEREGYICGYDDDMNLLCAGHKLPSVVHYDDMVYMNASSVFMTVSVVIVEP